MRMAFSPSNEVRATQAALADIDFPVLADVPDGQLLARYAEVLAERGHTGLAPGKGFRVRPSNVRMRELSQQWSDYGRRVVLAHHLDVARQR